MLKDQLLKDGYAVVKGVFKDDELKALKRTAKRYFWGLKKGPLPVRYSDLGQFISHVSFFPDFNWVFYHPGVLSTLKEIYGSLSNAYILMDSSILRNRLSDWHRDIGSQKFKELSWLKPECRIYQMGIYLEEHPNTQNRYQGLMVRPGSHLDPNATEEVKLDIHNGDLAIWDIRTMHSGPIPDRYERLISRAFVKAFKRNNLFSACLLKDLYWQARGINERYLLAFTAGANDEYSRKYAELMLAKHWNRGKFSVPENLRQELKAQGIRYLCDDEDGEYLVSDRSLIAPSGRKIETLV